MIGKKEIKSMKTHFTKQSHFLCPCIPISLHPCILLPFFISVFSVSLCGKEHFYQTNPKSLVPGLFAMVYLPNEAKWMHDYEKTKRTHLWKSGHHSQNEPNFKTQKTQISRQKRRNGGQKVRQKNETNPILTGA
jgi:hypothetical protein